MSVRYNKQKVKIVNLVILFIALFSFSVIQLEKQKIDAIETSSSELSNQKIGWGIKRNNNHEQPDLGKKNREILEKNDGIAMGNPEKKYIYLTFDEGYEAGYTPQILEVLKKHEVKATFFLTAHYLNTEPDLVKQMIDEGHIIGNHTSNITMYRM